MRIRNLTNYAQNKATRVHDSRTIFACLLSPLILLVIVFALATPLAAQDADRKAAAKLLSEANKLFQTSSGESLRRAIEKLDDALPLFRSANERVGEAATLSSLGRIYDALGDKGKSLEYFSQAVTAWRVTD